MNEEMSIGVLVAFSGYIWNLIWPMRMLGELTDLISRNLASAKKIFAIIEREPEIKSGLSNDTKNDSSDDVLNDNSNNSNSTDVDSNSDDDWSDLY